MAITLLDGIKFSDDSYSHISNLPDGFERLSIKLEGEIPSDFHAEAYINKITKEVVVSYRELME